MFGDKAFDLVKSLALANDILAPFEDEKVREVLEEISAIYDEAFKNAHSIHDTGDKSLVPLITFQDNSIHRNKRCLLVYLYNRLQRVKAMRWQFGAVIPNDIKSNLCDPEISFFNKYSQSLAKYMRTVGDTITLNLTEDSKPPKSLYIEVRCLTEYGKFELEDGEVILLTRNSQHYLPRVQCEHLVRQGVLKHID